MKKKIKQNKKRHIDSTEITFVFNEKAKFKAENKELIDRFRILNGILFQGRKCYELWWAYVKIKNKQSHFLVLLQYKDCVETIGYSCITSLIVDLYKLYDTQDSVYNVGDLVKEVEEIGLLCTPERKFVDQNMRAAHKIWEKILKLRHNLFAHRNADLTIEEIYSLAKVTPNNFRDMTIFILNVLNEIAPKLYETPKKFDRAVRKDTLKLFRRLTV